MLTKTGRTILHGYFVRANIFNVLTHVIGWLLFLLLPVFFLSTDNNNNIQTFLFGAPYWIYVFIYGSIFYLHNYVLLPRLYFGGHRAVYFLLLALFGIAILIIKPFDNVVNITRYELNTVIPGPFHDNIGNRPPQQDLLPHIGMLPPKANPGRFPRGSIVDRPFRGHPDVVAFILYMFIIVSGVLMGETQKLRKMQQQLLQTEAEKSKAELTFLKAQINPHFLFNTLNNIYSLAASQHKGAPEAILKLSGIMHYIMDSTENVYVPLSEEIECIDNYIYLQRLRQGQTTRLDYTCNGYTADKKIAPLILISFIENVFKYGISKHELSPIEINITVNGGTLTFISENKIFRNESASGKGLGISNTRKRLELMYAGKYNLDISRKNNRFNVRLIVNLNG